MRKIYVNKNPHSTMPKFNTTTVMLLDEDIQLKQQNARSLMIEDIENALKSAEDNEIKLNDYCFIDNLGDDVCQRVRLYTTGLGFYCEYGYRSIDELDYEQLHTVYEALKSEGYFNEEN